MSVRGFGVLPAVSLEVFAPLSARRAIEGARQLGAAGVGLAATRRDFAPAVLGESGTRDLSVFLAKNGLGVSWVSTGGRGRFALSETLDEDVALVRSAIELAGRLRAAAVAACCGRLGQADSQPAANLREAVGFLAAAADSAGVTVAVEAFSGEQELLTEVLGGFAEAPVGHLVDPGAILFAGADCVERVSSLRKVTAVRASDCGAEQANLAPGEGRVPWRDFLAALAARDYYGYVTVEFGPGGNAMERASSAVDLLRRFSVS